MCQHPIAPRLDILQHLVTVIVSNVRLIPQNFSAFLVILRLNIYAPVRGKSERGLLVMANTPLVPVKALINIPVPEQGILPVPVAVVMANTRLAIVPADIRGMVVLVY